MPSFHAAPENLSVLCPGPGWYGSTCVERGIWGRHQRKRRGGNWVQGASFGVLAPQRHGREKEREKGELPATRSRISSASHFSASNHHQQQSMSCCVKMNRRPTSTSFRTWKHHQYLAVPLQHRLFCGMVLQLHTWRQLLCSKLDFQQLFVFWDINRNISVRINVWCTLRDSGKSCLLDWTSLFTLVCLFLFFLKQEENNYIFYQEWVAL